MTVAYEEFIEFIAGGPSAQAVADFQASEETKAHVEDLIRRQKTAGLSTDEQAELEHFLHIEHLMRLAKARARLRLQERQ
jgi:hypothetical protein